MESTVLTSNSIALLGALGWTYSEKGTLLDGDGQARDIRELMDLALQMDQTANDLMTFKVAPSYDYGITAQITTDADGASFDYGTRSWLVLQEKDKLSFDIAARSTYDGQAEENGVALLSVLTAGDDTRWTIAINNRGMFVITSGEGSERNVTLPNLVHPTEYTRYQIGLERTATGYLFNVRTSSINDASARGHEQGIEIMGDAIAEDDKLVLFGAGKGISGKWRGDLLWAMAWAGRSQVNNKYLGWVIPPTTDDVALLFDVRPSDGNWVSDRVAASAPTISGNTQMDTTGYPYA